MMRTTSTATLARSADSLAAAVTTCLATTGALVITMTRAHALSEVRDPVTIARISSAAVPVAMRPAVVTDLAERPQAATNPDDVAKIAMMLASAGPAAAGALAIAGMVLGELDPGATLPVGTAQAEMARAGMAAAGIAPAWPLGREAAAGMAPDETV
jgi:hypothetical protein